jgi:hypothetical protein
LVDNPGNPTATSENLTDPVRRKSIGDGLNIPNTAVFLKRTALEFLQILFSERAPGSYHFDHDDTKTEIIISDLHAVDLKMTGMRPAIVAVRGPLSWQGPGLGSVQSRDIPTGAYTFKELLTGSLALSCISREGVEAEQIAHIVFNSFKFFRPVLQKYGYFQIKSLSIGGEALVEIDGSNDMMVVIPITVTALIEDQWILEETAARQLKKLVISQLSQL